MKSILAIFVLILFFVGCTNSMKGDSKAHTMDSVSILRFDKDLYTYIQSPTPEAASKLVETYPELLPAFGQITVNKSMMENREAFFNTIQGYFAHPMLSRIYTDEIQTFEDLSLCEQELSEASRLAMDYLKCSLPQFAVHVSGFKENVIVLDKLISLSGDKYLGSNYAGYSQFFAEAERRQMESRLMSRDYLKAWIISDKIVEQDNQASLLVAMIEEGKTLYLLSQLLPQYSREDLLGFTSVQLAWCENNKKDLWKETLKNNKLFSTDRQLISRYIEEGAIPIPALSEVPPRVGSWIGWQIVEQYVEKSKESSLQDILSIDAQSILKSSKYNP